MKASHIALLAAAVALGFPVAGNAKDITLTLSDQEQQAFLQILDLAARQGGVKASGNISYFAQKIAREQKLAPGEMMPMPERKPDTSPPKPKQP